MGKRIMDLFEGTHFVSYKLTYIRVLVDSIEDVCRVTDDGGDVCKQREGVYMCKQLSEKASAHHPHLYTRTCTCTQHCRNPLSMIGLTTDNI